MTNLFRDPPKPPENEKEEQREARRTADETLRRRQGRGAAFLTRGGLSGSAGGTAPTLAGVGTSATLGGGKV